MAIKYCDVVNGHDDTGDGSVGNPWQTIYKGMTSVGSGNTLKLAAGTYAFPDTINGSYRTGNDWKYTSLVTVERDGGTLGDVILTGPTPGSNAYDIQITGDISNLTFSGIKFQSAGNAIFLGTFSSGTIVNLHFDDCDWTMGSGVNYPFIYGGAALNGLQWNRCSMTFAKASGHGLVVTALGAGYTLTGIKVDTCTIATDGGAFAFRGITNSGAIDTDITASDTGGTCVLTMIGQAGFASDSLAGTAGSNPFTGNYMTRVDIVTSGGAAGYAHLAGVGAEHTCAFDTVTFDGDQWGDIFIKVSQNSSVVNCVNSAAKIGVIEWKAAINADCHDNTGFSLSVPSAAELAGLSTTGCSFDHNTMTADASGEQCYNVSADYWTAGSNVVDYNALFMSGDGKIGTVKGTELLATLATLRAAWTGDDAANSDHDQLNPVAATLTVTNKTGVNTIPIALTGTLLEAVGDAAIVGATVAVTVNSVLQGTCVTDAAGAWSYTYTIPSGTNPASQTISATSTADDTHYADTGTGTLTCTVNTSITVNTFHGQAGDVKTITGTLTRSDTGVALASRSVVIKLDGSTINTATTNASGVYSYDWTVAGTEGAHAISATFAFLDGYKTSIATGVATVDPTPLVPKGTTTRLSIRIGCRL